MSRAEREAFDRGARDFQRDRSPLFRRTVRGIVPDLDDPGADNWDDAERHAYCDGYADGYEEAS